MRDIQKKIEELQVEITGLKKKESILNSEETKYKDELKSYKQHKQFLDLLAISSGLKEYKPRKRKDTETGASFNLNE